MLLGDPVTTGDAAVLDLYAHPKGVQRVGFGTRLDRPAMRLALACRTAKLKWTESPAPAAADFNTLVSRRCCPTGVRR